MKSIRIFIVDDHAILRAGIAAVIEKQDDMSCVGEAADGQEALTSIAASKADVVLVDLEMPRCDGLRTIELLGEAAPTARSIALTMHQETHHIQAAIAAGASAFVAKHMADTELLQTIRRVRAGSPFLCLVDDRVEPAALPRESSPSEPELCQTLSERERQVLKFLVLGHTNREIAQELQIGTKSVETYRSRISQKSGMKTRAELVRYAINAGLLRHLVADDSDPS